MLKRCPPTNRSKAMASVPLFDHVKELQQLELAKVFYKIAAFVASAILTPLLIWFIISSSTKLDKLVADQSQMRTDLAILQNRMNTQAAHHNASLDAAKAQAREATEGVNNLTSEAHQLISILISQKKTTNPPQPRRKKVRHAARR